MPNTIFLCSASIFWHWKLEAEHKKNYIGPCWSFWAPKTGSSKRCQAQKISLAPIGAFKLPSSKAPKHVECKFFYGQPPTFDVESWRPSIKHFPSTLLWGSELGVQKSQEGSNEMFLCLASNFRHDKAKSAFQDRKEASWRPNVLWGLFFLGKKKSCPLQLRFESMLWFPPVYMIVK
jgi:hypothetical protein